MSGSTYGTMGDNAKVSASTAGTAGTGGQKKKRVLVVGAGAAGMSCAHHLSLHPSKFDVTVIEASNHCGGQAFAIPIDKEKYAASWMNQGVQGGSLIFHHTMTMFARQGYQANPVDLQVSFGKDENFWTNVFPTKLLERHQGEIKRFVKVMKLVRWFELGFALIPIKHLMRMFFFSKEFTNTIVLPMVALFLGTGNATPNVPTIILERLCTSPTYGMWYPLDKRSMASNLPPMVVFPNFSEFYSTWKNDLEQRGVNVRLNTEVTRVVRRDKNGVVVRTIKRTAKDDGHNPNSSRVPYDKDHNEDPDAQETEEHYDELVLCVLADTAKRLLEPTSSFFERHILGSAKFADDITITHSDAAYMKKHYTNFYDSSQAVDSLSGEPQDARLQRAQRTDSVGETGGSEGGFKPMYLIKTYPKDRRKLEMCFDCTNYQAQFPPSLPFEKHVFQTIFLNKKMDQGHWDVDEIDEDKIIRKDWWHQVCHSWTHYLFVVPWMWLLNRFISRRKHTRFAAAWTLVNAHEVAVISGIAAAVDLGAEYPNDLIAKRGQGEVSQGWLARKVSGEAGFAFMCFRLYYLLAYGRWYSKKSVDGETSGDWDKSRIKGEGIYGSVYTGPGVSGREREMWRVENGM